jgi:hypothetical protein
MLDHRTCGSLSSSASDTQATACPAACSSADRSASSSVFPDPAGAETTVTRTPFASSAAIAVSNRLR